MIKFDQLTRLEQVLLLGFIPILGATTTFGIALAGVVIGIVVSLAVWGASLLIPHAAGENTRWILLPALAFGLTYGLASVARFVTPLPSGGPLYLYLIAATPLVYAGAGTLYRPAEFRGVLARFALIMLLFGLVRETLGQGTLLRYYVWAAGTTPAGILATASGGLLLFASVALSASVLRSALQRSKNRTEPHSDTQSVEEQYS